MNSYITIVATQCSLGTMVCLRNISVDTLHKGDTEMMMMMMMIIIIISTALLQECKSRKKNVCAVWIDYQKPFASVPHGGIIKSFQLTGMNNRTISFTKKTASYWKTSMALHTEGKIKETEGLEIQRGLFQGDSLSPLLFFVSLIPLAEQLNKLNTEYEEHTTKTKISHLFYMDDLKLTGKTEE
jgi:hypothetical protein